MSEAINCQDKTKSAPNVLAAGLECGDLEARRAGEMTAWGGAKRSPRYAKWGLALKARRHVLPSPCDLFYL